MKKIILKGLLIGLASVATLTAVQAELVPYTATYYATFDRFSGRNTSSLSMNKETGEYTYSSYTKPRGLAALAGKIRESARFTLVGGTINPIAYAYKARDKAFINYDWQNKVASTNDDGKLKDVRLKGHELDILNLQMQLMEDLNNESLKEEYTVIKGNDLKTYSVTRLEDESIQIGKKNYAAVKLKQKRQGSSRHTFMWLAKDLQHTVIKMEQYKGEKLRGTLTLTGYKLIK